MKLRVAPLQFVKELYREICEDDIFNGAAVLGFYLTLAIFPAVIFVMALLPYLPVPRIDEAIGAASCVPGSSRSGSACCSRCW